MSCAARLCRRQRDNFELGWIESHWSSSGNLGGGTLSVGGKQYSFSIGGLGIGGFGVSRMEAYGTVYNLKNINDFAGGYVQARYGIAVGSMSTGQLWLQNTHGVVLELKAKRTGLALSLGGDAVYINFD